MIKKLIWLIKHQKDIEKLIEKGPKEEDKKFSLAGVPEYQLNYINDILEEKK